MLSVEAIEAIRDDCLADDVDYEYSQLSSLTEAAARLFFENGGGLTPAECTAQTAPPPPPPPPAPYEPPPISFAFSVEEIAASIERHGDVGLLLLVRSSSQACATQRRRVAAWHQAHTA